MISGSLGQCDDPDCLDCPKNKMHLQRRPALFDDKDGGWMRRIWSSFPYIPVMNPHSKAVRRWNKFFAISCLIAIFIDPLFFFLLSMDKDNKCIVFNWQFGEALIAARTLTDAVYFLHMLLQFRMAYIDPESRVVGSGDLVDEPGKICIHYLRSAFIVDFFVLLPLPQVIVMRVIPKYVGLSSANYVKNLLRAIVILQYAPRIFRFVPLLGGQSANGFIFESAWANFVINLLIFVLAGHVVGSCWYHFGLQNVNQCLQNACVALNMTSCAEFTDCGYGISEHVREKRHHWFSHSMTQGCFDTTSGSYKYGIYEQVVLLTAEPAINRYVYSLFWGFQQISTLAGNLVPSYFVWEVLFTKAIIVLGLLLFALLIGNMQNFLQSLGKRRLDMQLRRHDVEQWMGHRQLPEDLRRRVRQAERFSWVATRGVNEEEILSNLPEDIQRDIQHHFFRFLDKFRLFTVKDCPIWDAICHKLKHNLYITGSDIICQGRPVEKVVFIVRGKLESIAEDGSKFQLHKGAVCGEELLMWYLEQPSVNRDAGEVLVDPVRWMSIRTIRCLTNVEAFVLQRSDLEEVTSEFSMFLCNPSVIAAIRYESPRILAASRIQIAWRHRQRRRRAEAVQG
ncbi:probable cyclic nucleotide-gated ion channel 20, chloroplastic [Lolium perenne]|uniref:probable cyclic nucleotide-gated ion channel 20, chloroplastic n=1 Tax=Lolium perenne TaxID=4522 RepID=UPI0021F609DD|nr:probable cyclic nucleotide-gated ion channel 20, chloroplastic [Lolium perenne]